MYLKLTKLFVLTTLLAHGLNVKLTATKSQTLKFSVNAALGSENGLQHNIQRRITQRLSSPNVTYERNVPRKAPRSSPRCGSGNSATSVSSCDGGALPSHLIGPHPVPMATCSDKTPHDIIPIRASRLTVFFSNSKKAFTVADKRGPLSFSNFMGFCNNFGKNIGLAIFMGLAPPLNSGNSGSARVSDRHEVVIQYVTTYLEMTGRKTGSGQMSSVARPSLKLSYGCYCKPWQGALLSVSKLVRRIAFVIFWSVQKGEVLYNWFIFRTLLI